MVQIYRCDKCGKDMEADRTHAMKDYNRNTKTYCMQDWCNECFILGFLTIHVTTAENKPFYEKLGTIKPKWKVWNKELKKMVDFQ